MIHLIKRPRPRWWRSILSLFDFVNAFIPTAVKRQVRQCDEGRVVWIL
jgi:hypothetical protein